MTTYRIRNWSKYFENAKSRSLAKCSHVYMPNKQDGLSFSRVLAHEQGAAIFGLWCMILQACSRQNPRLGWLTEDGSALSPPWNAADLAFRWRRPVAEVEMALEVLSNEKIAWIERVEVIVPEGDISQVSDRRIPRGYHEDTDRIPRHPLTEQNRTEGKGTEPTPTPRGDGDGGKEATRQKNRQQIQHRLVRLRLPAGDEQVTAWGGLAVDAGAKGIDEILSCIHWCVGNARAEGIAVKWAEHCEAISREWREWQDQDARIDAKAPSVTSDERSS